jgi:hypothetical protein
VAVLSTPAAATTLGSGRWMSRLTDAGHSVMRAIGSGLEVVVADLLAGLDELERLWVIATPYIATKLATPEARMRTVKEHRRILRALRARRRSQAIDELARHGYQRTELKSVALPGWRPDPESKP